MPVLETNRVPVRVDLHADLSEHHWLLLRNMPPALQLSGDSAQYQGCSRGDAYSWNEFGRAKCLPEKLLHLTPNTLSTDSCSSSQVRGRSKTDRVSGKPVNDQFLAFYREPGANFG